MRVAEYTLIVLIAGVALAFDISIMSQFALPKLLILRIGTLALCLIWLTAHREGAILPFPMPVLCSAMALGLWSILATITALHGYTSLHGVYGWYNGLFTQLNYLLLFYLIATLPIDKLKILKAYVIVMSIVAVYAIFQKCGIDFVDFPHSRPASTIGNAVPMSACLLLALPFSLYFALKKKAWFVVSLILLAGIVISQSRGVQLALILTALIIIFVYGWRYMTKKATAFVIISLLCAGVLTFIVFVNFANSGLKERYNPMNISQDEGVKLRLHYYQVAWAMIKDRPIMGFGLDNMKVAFSQYRTPELATIEQHVIPTEPHNVYLAKAVNGGIPLLIFYLAFIVSVLRHINRSDKILAVAFVGAITGYLIQDISGWSHSALQPMFYILIALGVRE